MEQKFYLNFNEKTGEIWKVTNELDDTTPYLEISRELMVEFTEQKKNMDDYIVVPSDTGEAKFDLKFKHRTLESFDVDKSIHQLPKYVEDQRLVFYIIQDTKQKCWKAKLSSDLKKLLSSTGYYKDKNHVVFVTDQDDPNFLLDTLVINFSEVLTKEYQLIKNTNPMVAQRRDVSVYCGKVFENYMHVLEE